MGIAIRLIRHARADGNVLGLNDGLRCRSCGRLCRGHCSRSLRGLHPVLVGNIDQRAAQTVRLLRGSRNNHSSGCRIGRGFRRGRSLCRGSAAARLFAGLRCRGRFRSRVNRLHIVRIVQRDRIGEVSGKVESADSQLFKLVHVVIQLNVQLIAFHGRKQHAVDLNTGNPGKLVPHINVQDRVCNVRAHQRSGQVNGADLRRFIKRPVVGIGHSQHEGAVLMNSDFCFALVEQILTVRPGTAVHAVLNLLPADAFLIGYRRLDFSSVIVCPSARRDQHNPVRIARQDRRFCCDFRRVAHGFRHAGADTHQHGSDQEQQNQPHPALMRSHHQWNPPFQRAACPRPSHSEEAPARVCFCRRTASS